MPQRTKLSIMLTAIVATLFLGVAWISAQQAATEYRSVDQPSTAVGDDRAQEISVLMYHHFADSDTGAAVSHGRFKEQMRWLRHNQYYTATLQELLDFLQGDLVLPAKTVVITIDDGYASNYEIAYPILKEYDMHAAIFVIGSSRGKTPGWTPHFSWPEAHEMGQSGNIEIHAHTHDMHRMDESDALTLTRPEEQVLIDLLTNRVEIMDHVGTNAFAFAYPYGRYNDTLLELVERAGFRLAFTTEQGRVRPDADPMLLPRINVPGGLPLEDFVRLVSPSAGTRPMATDGSWLFPVARHPGEVRSVEGPNSAAFLSGHSH